MGCDSVSNTLCYASLAAFDLLSCGVGEILGENIAQAKEVSVGACSWMQGSDRSGHTNMLDLLLWLSCQRLAEQGAHGAHTSARTSHAHTPMSYFPCHPKLHQIWELREQNRGRAHVSPFNVLLTDVSPSQKKEQVHLTSLCLVSPWRGCVQAAHCSSQLCRLFKGSVHFLDLTATMLHFCTLAQAPSSWRGGDGPSRGCSSFHRGCSSSNRAALHLE